MAENDNRAVPEGDLGPLGAPNSVVAPTEGQPIPTRVTVLPLQSPSRTPMRLAVGGFVLVLSGLLATVYFGVSASVKTSNQQNGADQLNSQSLSRSALQGIAPKSSSGDYTVSGNLKVTGTQQSNGLVLNPSSIPSAPQKGQIYFDQSSNLIYYFDGTSFISLLNVNSGVLSLGGQAGNLSVGNGLGFSGGTLVNTGVLGLSSPDNSIGINKTNGGNYQLTVLGSGSGSVNSLDGLTGVLSVANSSGSGGTITVDDASTSAKGIAKFDSTNFSASSGLINTIQGISATATPTFAGLTLSSALTVGNGGTGAITAAGARGNLGAAASGANSDITSLSGLTTALSILQGGTGSTTAGGARTNLGAAASGANSDITSLSGLTTALSILQGGTGATTAGGARTSLGAAASGANSDITSLSGLTTALSVLQGGTGATTAGGARTSLGAASSGANSDITSLSGLTTALSVLQGGTGATTAGGARTSLGAAASGANSDITSLSGLTTALSVLQGGTGATTAGGALTNLGAASNSLAFLTVGNDASLSGERGIAVNATNLSFTDGGANGSYTINTIQGIATTSTPAFAGATLSNASSLTLGQASTNTGSILFKGSGSANTITLAGPTSPSTNTLTLPNETGTLCSTGSVCTGYAPASGSANYIQNQIASQQSASNFWISGTGRADTSLLTPTLDTASAGILTIGGTTATGVTLGKTSTAFTVQGSSSSVLTATSGGFTTTLGFATPTASVTINAPALAAGTYTICTSSNNCGAGAPNSAAFLTVGNDATLTNERAIAVNATNLSFTDGGANGSYTINTIQGIAITSTPTFAGATLTNASSLTLGQASTNIGSILFKGSGSANTITLQGPSSPSTNTLTLPNETGTLCSTGSVCTGYAAATGASGYIQNATSVQASANFAIQSAAAGSIGGLIRAASGQTADLFDAQDSGGNVIANIDANGNINEITTGGVYRGGADSSGTTNSGAGSAFDGFAYVFAYGRYVYAIKNSSNASACSSAAGSAVGCEFQVYDNSNAGNPLYLGGADASGSTNSGTTASTDSSVFVSGRYAYVSRNGNATACSQTAGSAVGCELQIYDISSPGSPTYVGGVDSSGSTNSGTGSSGFSSTFVSGHYAYVAAGGSSTACSQTAGSAIGCELQVYDVSNPANPTYVGGADASGSANSGTGNLGPINSIFVSGRYAYLARGANGNTACSQTAGSAMACELQVYDITNPAIPTYVGGADSTGSTNSGGGGSLSFNSIAVSGRYAYIATGGNATACSQTAGSAVGCELQVYDISNAASPTYKGGADASGSTNSGTGSNSFSSIAVSGRYAYMVGTGNATACSQTAGSAIGCELQTYDVIDSTAPTYKGGADVSGSANSGTASATFNSISVSGRYAYTAKVASATACSGAAGSAIGCELQVYDLTGVEATAVNANSLESGSLQVRDSVTIGNQLSVGGGLTVGSGGIQSVGPVGINNDIVVRSIVNGDDLLSMKRFTDTSPTGNFLRLQDAAGNDLASISISGNLTVKAATINGNITVNGHFITANASGSTTIAANTAACGTGCTASITGNDTSGVITINTGTGPAAGTLGTVTFANAYGAAPNIVITPNTVPASSTFPQYYYGSTTTTFDLKSYNALSASVTYTFSYHVIQ